MSWRIWRTIREQRALTAATRAEQDAQTRALRSARVWAADPDGGGYFSAERDAVRAHDPECRSLAQVWKPRRGGRTCFGDIRGCDGGCETTFYVEGLAAVFPDCPRSWHYYCACCRAKAKACPCGREEQP